MFERLRELVNATEGKIRIVESGSGSALLSLMVMYWLPERDIDLVAVDTSKHALKRVRKYAKQLGLSNRVTTVRADASKFESSYLSSDRKNICVSQGLVGVYFNHQTRNDYLERCAKHGCGVVMDFMKGGTILCVSSEAMNFPVADNADDPKFGLHYATTDEITVLAEKLFQDPQIDDNEFSVILSCPCQ
jgi:hypothetical protein